MKKSWSCVKSTFWLDSSSSHSCGLSIAFGFSVKHSGNLHIQNRKQYAHMLSGQLLEH